MTKIIIKIKKIKAAELETPTKSDAGPTLNPIANAMRATGGKMPAVLLLQRIAHWMEYAKVVKLGKKWIVNSAEEWAAEAGLSRDQYKAAKKVLEDTGLIVSAQMPFGKRNLTHIRLTPRGKEILAEKRRPKGAKTTLQSTPYEAPKAQVPITPKLTVIPVKPPKKSWAELNAETEDVPESENHPLH